MKNVTLFLICVLYYFPSSGQAPIVLNNPSFENMPQRGHAPMGWYDCGFPGESETDIQPRHDNPIFGVTKPPSDGKTYISMVTRDNSTWEMISQRLAKPIKTGQYYKFKLDLCRSEVYVSPSRVAAQEVNYTSPIKLRIWGGKGYCSKKQLLAETPLVFNTQWLTYELAFTPEEDWDFILLECFYKEPTLFPYNGNLLVDNASRILPIEKVEADCIMARKSKLSSKSEADYAKFKNSDTLTNKQKTYKPHKRKNPNAKPFDYEKERSSTFSNKPVKKKKKERESSSHDWASSSDMPNAVETFMENMNVDFDKGTFDGTTRINLIYILGNIVRLPDFNTMTVGIAGKGKEREKLKQPFLQFMQEFGISEERIQFKKVKGEAAENDWVAKNDWYWMRIE